MLIPVYLLVLALEGGLLPWLVGSEAFSDAQVLHMSPVQCPDTSVLVLPSPSGNKPPATDHPLCPQLLAEPWLTRTDPSPGQSLAAAIHLGPRVWNPLFPPQLLFLRARLQTLCPPACFAVAREQRQPTRVPWEVIPG